MKVFQGVAVCDIDAGRTRTSVWQSRRVHRVVGAAMLCLLGLIAGPLQAQVSVLTAHNDLARTGQNLNETTLTPSNVNSATFGKLFSQPISGGAFAQPLYVWQLPIPVAGTNTFVNHNVVYVATTTDMVYAFDADSNGGTNANPIWQVSLLTNSTPSGTLSLELGVYGTPVIDLPSQTMYLVSSEYMGTASIYRLHALDITTGAEKLGGPVQIQASIPGTGTDSTAGILKFDPLYQTQRPGLLLLNGVVYAAFGSVGDQGPWHGWLFSYNAATLQQIDVFCTSANGSGSGIWMGGAGLAAEVNDSTKPYGRMFVATANGSYETDPPTVPGQAFSNPSNEYGMSVLDLDLTGGVMTVDDEFTPYNEGLLDAQDGDLGSGGPVLLPSQTLASGKTLSPLIEIGKLGTIYILDRNQLGGFNAAGDQIVQEVLTPQSGRANWGAGVWGSEAYWNNNIYAGGTNPDGADNALTAYSFMNGVLSTTPTSESAERFSYPGPTPAVSANGATNGIVWLLKTDQFDSLGFETLLAYDATNLANTLYSSNTNISRDNPGIAGYFKYNVPTIANGKVYVTGYGEFNVYGLLGSTPTTPAPVITPGSKTYTGSQKVTITDALPGAILYYTTNGSTPTSKSPVYSKQISVTTNETITAIASATGYLQSGPSSATYTSTNTTANPVFMLAGGTYSGTQLLTITDSSNGATIYYTVDGSTPTTASPVYTPPLSIPFSETVQAIAVAPGLFKSSIVSATYTITPVYTIDFSNGFSLAQSSGLMTFNGSTDLDDFRLQLTNGAQNEAGSAFYTQPVNIQGFTTDFTFQLSNPAADGITFTIQGVGPTALGGYGAGLGFVTIQNSVAIKFDLFNNSGEGPDSTGLYYWGNLPTNIGSIDLSSSPIDLHSGDYILAHITYDGTYLTLTLTDSISMQSWWHEWQINIPQRVGSNMGWVGFTGSTGGLTSSQKLTSWTYLAQQPAVPNYPASFSSTGLALNGGAAVLGGRLRLTDNIGVSEARSAFYPTPVNIQQFTTSFNFQLTDPNAEGFTFTVQGVGPNALGSPGGSLGYGVNFNTAAPPSIAKSVAVKFDINGNSGEGPESTGLYTDGAVPTVPAISLVTTPINLHSGDVFNANFTYNGTTLTVVITDTVTHASATQTYTVNIPQIVGGPAAYIGFTGSTGGSTAIQEILNWTYSAVP